MEKWTRRLPNRPRSPHLHQTYNKRDRKMSSRQRLSAATRRFCDDFAHKQPTDALLAHFSHTRSCEVFEHGLPRFAPFLGSTFRGRDGVQDYFDAVAALIYYENMRFSEYIVDEEVRKVSVKGTATFTWIATRESWEETFTYVLDFDERDKIVRYQIWGDTGALYLASEGRLTEVSGCDVAFLHRSPESCRWEASERLLGCSAQIIHGRSSGML